MKILVVLLAIVAAISAAFATNERRRADEASATVTMLQAQLAERASMATELQLQERCAKQAERTFHAYGYNLQGSDDFESHFNVALNRCLMLVRNYPRQVPLTLSMSLLDAFDRRQYASYFWADKEVPVDLNPPMTCELTLPGVPTKTCHSQDEFDGMVKTLME